VSGPTCGRVTHTHCVRGCLRKPLHPGRCVCIHGKPLTDAERTEDDR
jgi:hypothetical protein